MPTDDELKEQQLRTLRLQEQEILKKRRQERGFAVVIIIGIIFLAGVLAVRWYLMRQGLI